MKWELIIIYLFMGRNIVFLFLRCGRLGKMSNGPRGMQEIHIQHLHPPFGYWHRQWLRGESGATRAFCGIDYQVRNQGHISLFTLSLRHRRQLLPSTRRLSDDHSPTSASFSLSRVRSD